LNSPEYRFLFVLLISVRPPVNRIFYTLYDCPISGVHLLMLTILEIIVAITVAALMWLLQRLRHVIEVVTGPAGSEGTNGNLHTARNLKIEISR